MATGLGSTIELEINVLYRYNPSPGLMRMGIGD